MTDIRVVVKTLTGGAFHLEISPFEKIIIVKETLCQIQGLLLFESLIVITTTTTGIPVSHQQLIWRNSILKDEMTLEEYGFGNFFQNFSAFF